MRRNNSYSGLLLVWGFFLFSCQHESESGSNCKATRDAASSTGRTTVFLITGPGQGPCELKRRVVLREKARKECPNSVHEPAPSLTLTPELYTHRDTARGAWQRLSKMN